LAGVPIETIAELMGHEDIRTIIKYPGLKMNDKASAIRNWPNSAHCNIRGRQKSQCGSGQGGI
jgi:hypothetical protein